MHNIIQNDGKHNNICIFCLIFVLLSKYAHQRVKKVDDVLTIWGPFSQTPFLELKKNLFQPIRIPAGKDILSIFFNMIPFLFHGYAGKRTFTHPYQGILMFKL